LDRHHRNHPVERDLRSARSHDRQDRGRSRRARDRGLESRVKTYGSAGVSPAGTLRPVARALTDIYSDRIHQHKDLIPVSAIVVRSAALTEARTMLGFAILICAVALAFDFLNGFHDAANSIATVVSTRVLSPRAAVTWAAFFNFVAAFTFGTAVAKTMGRGMIRLDAVNLYVILAGLLGAIVWDIVTWYYGLPVSSSHALIGGYAGAAVAKAGWGVILLNGWNKTILFIFLSPAIGLVLGAALMIAVSWVFRRWPPRRV